MDDDNAMARRMNATVIATPRMTPITVTIVPSVLFELLSAAAPANTPASMRAKAVMTIA